MKENSKVYFSCSRCVLDSNDYPKMVIDENGVCDICIINEQRAAKFNLPEDVKRKQEKALINEIKEAGKGSEYDCIIGVSGGIDSSYLAYYLKKARLRPLAIHLDNGWNSELAVKNIEVLLKKLDIDLITYVINWNEFLDIQLAYFKASVVDIEVVTDHAINAVLYKFAKEKNIKYILNGENYSSEGFLPPNWVHNKNDLINLKAIHRKFGKVSIKTYPTLGFVKLLYFQKIMKIQNISFLNYINYNKIKAKEILIKELNWRDYGGKHFESVFTRFYQSYILPNKFHIDKRKSHLSALICSGQITKEEALLELKNPIINEAQLLEDKEYVLKKLNFSEEEFERYMKLPIRKHKEFHSFFHYFDVYVKIRSFFKS